MSKKYYSFPNASADLRTGCLNALLLVAFLSFSAFAQSSPESAEPAPAAKVTAPVVLDEKEVFRIESTYKGLTIEERAANVSGRLRKLAEDRSVNIDDIKVVETELASDIVSGDTVIFSAVDSDAKAEARSRASVAAERMVKIKNALSAYREKYGLRSALTGVGLSVVAIAAFWILFFLIRKNFPRPRDWVLEKTAKLFSSRKWKVLSIIDVAQVKQAIGLILNLLRMAVIVTMFFVTLQLVLGFLPWTENIASGLLGLLVGPLRTLGAALIAEIPNLIFVGVVIVIAFYGLKLLKTFFRAVERRQITFKAFAPEWSMFTYRLTKIGVVILALIISFPYIPGSDSEAFRAIGIFLGVLVSFGSTSIVANTVGGITLNYLRTFNVGDRVKIGEYTGDIIRSSLQVTHLRTIKNEEIMVPNSMVVGSQIVNYSTHARDSGLILHTKVTIGYDTPWRQVHELLLMAARKTEGVLSEPKPFILQTALDDFYAEYELNVYTRDPKKMAVIYSDLHMNIQDAFNEYGVQIMSPNYMMDREEPTFVPKEKWFEAPAIKPEEKKEGEEEK